MLRAHKTGKGCDVDVCLFDVALHQLSYPATWYLNERRRCLARLPRSAHSSVAPVADLPDRGRLDLRHVHDATSSGTTGRALGRPDLTTDARFATPARAGRTATR